MNWRRSHEYTFLSKYILHTYCIFNEFDRNIVVNTFFVKITVLCFEDKFTRIFFFNIAKNYALIKKRLHSNSIKSLENLLL